MKATGIAHVHRSIQERHLNMIDNQYKKSWTFGPLKPNAILIFIYDFTVRLFARYHNIGFIANLCLFLGKIGLINCIIESVFAMTQPR